MYPNLYYAFKDLFGVEWTGLRFVNSFGFFVALGFLAAAFVLTLELKRKERIGLMVGKDVRIMVGKPAAPMDLLVNFLLGFLLGFKIIGLFLSNRQSSIDPQEFIFSSQGNLPAGIILGLFFAGIKWYEKNKQKLAKPEERTIRIWPHDRVGDIVILAALFGFLGAKIFHNLEDWQEFRRNPIDALLSFSGLTFYGGLICATLAIAWYAKKHKIGFLHLCDAAAPALMLAYAIGRIGCQVSGDGDWGILNSAYVTTPDSKVVRADSVQFKTTLQLNSAFYKEQFQTSNLDDVKHKKFVAPLSLPFWTVAYHYPQNVINEGTEIVGCESQGKNDYCRQLPLPVYPTSLYETVICLLLFLFLWALRNKLKIAGTMFAVYLIVNGIERFFIEKIRVNSTYDIFGFHPTQAELISGLLVISGLTMLFILSRRKSLKQAN